MERFEAKHWPCDPLDEAVILLNDVVEIFRLHNADDPTNPRELEDGVDTLQSSKISATFVDDNALGDTVGGNGTLEKPAGCSRVAVLRQHEFKGLTVAVDRAVQICLFTTHSDVGFVHPPRASRRLLSGLRICGDLWCVFHHPAVQCGMIDFNAAFRHDLFKITIRDAVTNIEKHCLKDHALRKRPLNPP